MPVLQLNGVLKRYGETLGVGPIDLDLEEGEFLALLGPSGCGKTTTLHIIAGLLFPDQGSVHLGDREITTLDPQHRDMGLVFQNYALFPHKTIFDNIGFGLRMRKVAKEEIRGRVHRMLELVGLAGIDARYPDQLSGGQRQRVALARALIIEPTVLLLDEPLSNLDAVLRKRMRLELREIQQRLGIATVFVTHDQDEAFSMSDRVVLMNLGQVEQIGTPEDLYDNPASRFAAEFIGEANLIDGVIAELDGNGARIDAATGGSFTTTTRSADMCRGESVYLMVRPERIEIAVESSGNGTAIRAKITKRVFSGDSLSFTLRTENGSELLASKPSTPHYRGFLPDMVVWAELQDCRLLPKEV